MSRVCYTIYEWFDPAHGELGSLRREDNMNIKMKVFLVFLLSVFLIFAGGIHGAEAQDNVVLVVRQATPPPTAGEILATGARETAPLMTPYLACMTHNTKLGASWKDANKACQQMVGKQVNVTNNLADEASDAANPCPSGFVGYWTRPLACDVPVYPPQHFGGGWVVRGYSGGHVPFSGFSGGGWVKPYRR